MTEIDKQHPVALITVRDGSGSFHFYDRTYEKLLRRLFTEPAVAFVGGGTLPDGAHVDAAVRYPAWTKEAIDLIIGDKLRGFTLGGAIIEDNSGYENEVQFDMRASSLCGTAL